MLSMLYAIAVQKDRMTDERVIEYSALSIYAVLR